MVKSGCFYFIICPDRHRYGYKFYRHNGRAAVWKDGHHPTRFSRVRWLAVKG